MKWFSKFAENIMISKCC